MLLPKPAAPKTSLGKGAGAIRELEEKEKSQGTVKPRNSARDARDLKEWEGKTGNGVDGVDAKRLLESKPKGDKQVNDWIDDYLELDQSKLTPEQRNALRKELDIHFSGRNSVQQGAVDFFREVTGKIKEIRNRFGIEEPDVNYDGTSGVR